ncbi:hypothetical protein [Streptomyces sp. NPDC046182]
MLGKVQAGAGPLHGRRRVAGLKGEVAAGRGHVDGEREITRGAGQRQRA